MKYAEAFATPIRMTERSERLVKAMRDFPISQPEAVERWGWNANTLKSNCSGIVDFGMKNAQKYGLRLKVRPEWLYTGEEPMRPLKPEKRPDFVRVPIISWVSAGQLAAQIEDIVPDEEAWTVLSGLPTSRYFATLVQGDSMDRYSPEGSIVIVDAEDKRLVPGKAYIFAVNGETTYKVYQRDPVERLEPYSTNPSNKVLFPNGGNEWVVAGRVVRSFYDLP